MEIIIFILFIYITIKIIKEINYQLKKEIYFKQLKETHKLRKEELKKEKYKSKPITKSKFNYQYQFYKKNYILTKTELKFYKQLLLLTNKMNLTLLTQIPIYSIVKTKNTIYKNINFKKIGGKSIDFVITNKYLKPILCIELDDYTHTKPKRIERDIFVNDLFNDLEITLLRIPVNTKYNFEEIEYYLKQNLNSL